MFRCEGTVLEAHDISNGHFHADGLTQHWITEKITICLNRKTLKPVIRHKLFVVGAS